MCGTFRALTLQRRSAEEIEQIEEAEREAEVERHKNRFGKPDRRGMVTVTPADAANWSADFLYRFSQDEPLAFDRLLQGEDVRFVPSEEA